MDFEIYPGQRGQWYWRAKARNGRIVADSGEGYASRWNCERAVLQLCRGIRKQRVLINGKASRQVI